MAGTLAKAARTGYFAVNSAKFSGIFNLPHGCGKLIGAFPNAVADGIGSGFRGLRCTVVEQVIIFNARSVAARSNNRSVLAAVSRAGASGTIFFMTITQIIRNNHESRKIKFLLLDYIVIYKPPADKASKVGG